MTPSSIPPADIGRLSIAQWHALGDAPLRRLLAEFLPLVNASEMAIWVKDPGAERLVALFDTAGPDGPLELKVSQPLATGIVSQVFRDRKPFIDKGLWRTNKQSPLVDQALRQVTQNEMCVPLEFAGLPVGVVSAVQLTDSRHKNPVRWGFDERDLAILSVASTALGQSMERAMLSKMAAG
jgi:hypothetical protein